MIAITPWRRTLSTWVHPNDDLYTINPDYLDGVSDAGGRAALLGHATSVDDAKLTLSHFTGLLLSGGNDVDPSLYDRPINGSVDPDIVSDRSDLAYLSAARSLGLPVLGICKGLQIVNVAFGGTLHQDIWSTTDAHPARIDDSIQAADRFLANQHRVALTEGSAVARIMQSTAIVTNSLHHQAVDQVGDELRVTGRAEDGTVEALEHNQEEIVAVQWHPERMGDEGLALFRWLVDAANARSGRPQT